MNFYLLTEGRTEEIVYRHWLTYIFPNMRQVFRFDQIEKDNFIIKSSSGYPFRNTVLQDAIHTCNMYGKIDYLILIADCDDEDLADRKKFIVDQLQNDGLRLKHGNLKIFLQKKCFESWCLGSIKFNTFDGSSNYKKFVSFYDVSEEDPELMTKPKWFRKSNSIFHFYYFREMMKQSKQRYHKAHPGVVLSKYFFEDIVERIDSTPHLNSFKEFYNFMIGLSTRDR